MPISQHIVWRFFEHPMSGSLPQLHKSKLRSDQSGTAERCRDGNPAGNVEIEILARRSLLKPP